MKRFSICSLIVLFAIVATAFSQPKLRIEGGNNYDWGKVKPSDSPLKVKIKLFNVGTETLKITNVRPGCGCTTAPLDKDEVEPKDFATLDISLNISSYTGRVTKPITIQSNDPDSSTIVYHINAEIVRPITFFPNQSLSFGKAFVGKEVIAKVILQNKSDKKIKLTGVEVTPENIEVNIKKNDVIPANGEIDLTVKMIPVAAGPFNCKVKIKTDNPDMSDVEVTGWGQATDESQQVEEPKMK